jgi:hypothetical protein
LRPFSSPLSADRCEEEQDFALRSRSLEYVWHSLKSFMAVTHLVTLHVVIARCLAQRPPPHLPLLRLLCCYGLSITSFLPPRPGIPPTPGNSPYQRKKQLALPSPRRVPARYSVAPHATSPGGWRAQQADIGRVTVWFFKYLVAPPRSIRVDFQCDTGLSPSRL